MAGPNLEVFKVNKILPFNAYRLVWRLRHVPNRSNVLFWTSRLLQPVRPSCNHLRFLSQC